MNVEESVGYKNSDAQGARPSSRPSSGPELGRFAERLREAANNAKPAEISRKTGVNRRSIEGYLAGKNEPGRLKLTQLARGLDVEVEWLSTGQGFMRPIDDDVGPGTRRKMEVLGIMPRQRAADGDAQYGPESETVAADPSPASRTLPADQVLVPRYNLRAAAERGHIDTDADLIGYYGYGDAWVRGNLKADPAHLCVGIVVGDSMEPDLYDGEEMLVDLSVNQYVGDAIYLVRFESSLMIKQLQRVLGGTLRLVSRNDRYEAQTVHDRGDLLGVDFSVIGRVLGKPKFIKL